MTTNVKRQISKNQSAAGLLMSVRFQTFAVFKLLWSPVSGLLLHLCSPLGRSSASTSSFPSILLCHSLCMSSLTTPMHLL